MNMKIFIVCLVSLVSIAKSQVPGPNGKMLDIFFEPVEAPEHKSKTSEFMFFFQTPNHPSMQLLGVPLWQFNTLDESYYPKTLPGYYIYNPKLQTHYILKIKVDENALPSELYPEIIDDLEGFFRDTQGFQLEEKPDKSLRVVPMPTQ